MKTVCQNCRRVMFALWLMLKLSMAETPNGVAVISGMTAEHLACLPIGFEDQVTSISFYRRGTIAAQCCWPSGACARFTGTNDDNPDTGCINGYSSTGRADTGYLTEIMNYSRAKAACPARHPQLTLCTDACTGHGCHYDEHPVYTRLPCFAIPVTGVQVLNGKTGEMQK